MAGEEENRPEARILVYLDFFDPERKKWTARELALKEISDPEELTVILARLREWEFEIASDRKKAVR